MSANPSASPHRRIKYGAAAQHRGIRSYVWSWRQTLTLLVLLLAQWLLVALLYDSVQSVWQQVLGWAWPRLGLGDGAQVRLGVGQLWGQELTLVEVSTLTPLPDLEHRVLSALCALGLIAMSFFISRERLPLIYLMRAVALLVLIALLLYEFFTGVSNLNLAYMLDDMLKIGSALLWLLPLLHALVLYIFPLPWPLKAAATVLALLFTVIAIPLQVGAIGWIISTGSSLLLLLVYMLGTFLPHIAAQLGIYGYFISLARVPQ